MMERTMKKNTTPNEVGNNTKKKKRKKGKKSKQDKNKSFDYLEYSYEKLVQMGKDVSERKTGYEFGTQYDFRHHMNQDKWNDVVRNFYEMPEKNILIHFEGVQIKVTFGQFVSYLESLGEDGSEVSLEK